jgi:pimeloyl-ACP methyl ester carboxylesterase
MTDPQLPPVRSTHRWRAPRGTWAYDSWGQHGRPVVFIPAVLFDRRMWWPAAADLRPHATVVAVDLPGHGDSSHRTQYEPDELVDDLAQLIHHLGTRRAPIVVGHASSASLTSLFASRYTTHAVVVVDPPATSDPPADVHSYLEQLGLSAIPSSYHGMVSPRADPELLRAYARCMQPVPVLKATGAAMESARLALYSATPAAPPSPEENPGAQWRREIYGVAGCFAHLTDQRRFVHDIRALL